jgi:poly(A) polymerase
MITDAGEDLEDLMTLAEADITSKNPEKVKRILSSFGELRVRIGQINEADNWRTWHNPINGNEIMDYFGIPGSPVLSELKNAVKEAIFDGRIPNEHDAAWAYLLEIAPSYGLALPGK